MIIPKPANDSIYYLFHTAWTYDTIGNLGGYDNYMYYTVVDMYTQNGAGAVTDKNHILINDTIVGAGTMTACKHANGRDWWLIMPECFTNCFYKFLLTPNGIETVEKQCIGDSVHTNTDRGATCFSPDGSKYIWSNPLENLNLLDFDRCTGMFSNYQHYDVVDSVVTAQQGISQNGVTVSSNSKFLYLSTGTELRQFDLTQADILSSEVKLANVFIDSPSTSICYGQLAPDGKIYMVAVQQDTFLHVINYPDSAGLACSFVKNGIELRSWNLHYLPYYPNYRLGALAGSECDTLLHTDILESNEEQYKLKVFPNPTTNFVTVDYGFTDWNKGEVNLEITNELGQVVHQQPVPMYSGFQKVEVQNFAPGMYTAFIKRKGQVVATAKFVRL